MKTENMIIQKEFIQINNFGDIDSDESIFIIIDTDYMSLSEDE
jgi:hypothetical protein